MATVALAARADAYIYWANSDSGAISRANLDGTGATQSLTPRLGTAPNTPSGVAVDGAHIYWTYFNDGANIGRANLDGTGVEESFIVAPVSALSQVAVDGAHVYWVSKYSANSPGPPDLSSPGTGSIGRANLDGTGIDPNFITGISFPAGGLAVDGSHLYWTSYVNAISTLYHGPLPGAIGRANLNGTGVQESFITTMPTDFGVAVDGTHVWWVNEGPRGTGRTPGEVSGIVDGIARANLDGTGNEFVVAPGAIFARAIAVDDTSVYWSGPGSIGRSNLDGSALNLCFITNSAAHAGVAVDALGPPPSNFAVPSNEIRLGKTKLNKKRGSGKLKVTVPDPGMLRLERTKDVVGQSAQADQAGELKLLVKARGKAKKTLKKTGKAKLKAKVTYSSDCGASATKTKKVKLVKR